MIRADIISIIGREYLTTNIENEKFSYPKIFKEKHIPFDAISNKQGKMLEKLDLRFVKYNVSILIKTKTNFNKNDEKQLSAYVEYEKNLNNNKIIAILVNTLDDNIKVWRGVVSDANFLPEETVLRNINEYVDFYTSKVNDKEKIMQNTYKLNELLHKHGISEKLRSQFVGTCLLALKNNIDYKTSSLKAFQIRMRIKEVLETLLTDSMEKAEKLTLLNKNVLESQDIQTLKIEDFREILSSIEKTILPYINDKSTSGQDLLNLFFVTFNKYVGKSDKNQAFTPDHITDFIAKIVGVNKRSIILDPCCGSGSFLVRAMNQALEDCATASEQEKIKKEQIYGIEFDENIYGLATTNMLIHSDGNSNIRQGSCFDFKNLIQEKRPNIILMNPPYNAQRKHMPDKYTKKWAKNKKEDPSKGLYFVKYIMDVLNEVNVSATLAVLLPVACAIGTIGEIGTLKEKILEKSTLDAVFTLPNEVFYPGASVSVCCMIFKVGKKHSDVSNSDTYFGYCKDDGFRKKKNLGRVEQVDVNTDKGMWMTIEKEWIKLYKDRKAIDGKSALKKVNHKEEWICEAHMKTDYSLLDDLAFQSTIRNYYSYLIKENGYIND